METLHFSGRFKYLGNLFQHSFPFLRVFPPHSGDHAGIKMSFEDYSAHLIKRRLHRLDLADHIYAVGILLVPDVEKQLMHIRIWWNNNMAHSVVLLLKGFRVLF